jgi:uncharacterized membrane protein/protein-disulfide isomerase
MTSRTRWLVLGLALLGLVFAGAATYVHYRLLTEPNYVSPCDINARFNCSEVYLSSYGTVRGVSVAVTGLVFFSMVALLAGLSQPRAKSAEAVAPAYLFAMATVGLAVVLYLGWASVFVLKTYCILCIGTYVAVIGLFIVTGSAGSVPMMQLPGRLVSDLRDLARNPGRLFAALLFLALTAALIGWFPKEGAAAAAGSASATPGSKGDEAVFVEAWSKQPRVDLGIPADGAKIVVVKFNDWQCPSCKAAYYAYKPILDKYDQTMPGTIKYVTKDYPLNNKCNFNVPGQQHPGACEAAAAVRLAAEHGKTNEMIEWLFSHQESLTPQSVEEEAKTLLGVTDFAREYARFLPDIKRDAADGAALQVAYTPTYYINGVKAQYSGGGWLLVPHLEFALQYELKKAGVAPPPAAAK